ncbi:MAG TPA: DAK2 domain-containing protein [Acidimicrobiales bacterium]|nr:DAK2 domain-containing protein [Acidimicrobiales bacterium]
MTLTCNDVVQVVRTYAAALDEHREALNRLNVYPVPDGDTGTNMSLTVRSVIAEFDEVESSGQPIGMEQLAACLSHGSLMGARGNSGVILSQVLRGTAGGLKDADGEVIGAADLVEALERASGSAYAAVSNPVEGTILSVVRAAAEGARRAIEAGARGGGAASTTDIEQVVLAARQAAAEALARTPTQLAVLEAAGVVDAGGAGFLLFMDSLRQVVTGVPIEAPPAPAGQAATAGAGAVRPPGGPQATGKGPSHGADDAGAQQAGTPANGELGVADLRYEVMFFLEAPDEAIAGFRRVWGTCGGSVVIVGGDGLYNCHIHTDDIGAALEAAIEIGRPRQIRVTDLTDQVEEERWVREAEASGNGAGEYEDVPVACAVVAVCAGEGVERIFRSLGAGRTVAGGQSANPSTAEVLEAVAAVPSDQVVVLPNNPNVIAVAEQAAAHAAKKVRVVPTKGIPEGFSAMLAYDPEADIDTNVDNMTAAADHVVSGEVAQAHKDAMTPAGQARAGDWLGIARDGIRFVAPAPSSAADAAIGLLSQLVGESEDHEIVTIIEGEGSHPNDTRRVLEWLRENRSGVGTEVHHGGQPLYPYLFSIE